MTSAAGTPRTPSWFVGVPVSPGAWFAPLVARAPACLRVFHPDDLHMTVAFLGAAGEAAAERAWAEIGRYTGGSFEVGLAGLEGLGNPRRPSALSLVLDRGRPAAIAVLVALRDALVAAAGAEPDDRPPLPHITVARLGRKASPAERKSALEWARTLPPIGASVRLERVALYTWAEQRGAGGPQFRIVREQAL